jgi:hypothetical protein
MTALEWKRGLAVSVALVAISGAGTVRCFADEGGVSFWLPGSYDSYAAELQQPGWSLSVVDYYAAVSAGAGVARSREIETGRFPVGLSATVNANYRDRLGTVTVEPTYVFSSPLFGGQAAFGVSGSYGRDSGNLAGTLSGTLTSGGTTVPFARADSVSQSRWGFGDLAPVFSLRWNQGVNSVMTYVTANIPIGAYDPARLANLGIGHGAFDAGGSYTYHDAKTGHEFSGTLGLTYNFINPSTQYQSGTDLHFDWGASQSLTEQLHVGLAGYVYKQIGCDSGFGARFGCFQSQVLGVGPQAGLSFPVGSLEGYLSIKAYREFAAENRPDGWNAWLTFQLSPSAPESHAPAKAAAAR